MMDDKTTYHTIDEYVARFPAETQALLRQIRATIHTAAPAAQEIISYAMPAFAQHGNLVYFAARTGYIGFYPTGSGIAAFQQELAEFKATKGAVHFPTSQPLPLDLIARIVRFRVNENAQRTAAKGSARARTKASKG